MIEVIPELRLNEFKEVCCAKPRDLFARFGKRESAVTFDSNLDEPVPIGMSKIESIEYLESYDAIMQQSSRQTGTSDESKGHNDSDNDNA